MTQPLEIPYRSIDPQQLADISHLRTLAVCHYVWGGFTALISTVLILFLLFVMRMTTRPAPGGAPPVMWMEWVMIGMVAIMWVIGVLTIYSGYCLANRRLRTFSLIMAGINCLSVPIGLVLGVFTFIVLFRPSVHMMYQELRT